MDPHNSKTPNNRLRYERELRGWSQSKLAAELGTNTDRVSRWECGTSAVSPYYREKLCALFGKNAAELELIEHEHRAESSQTSAPSFASSTQASDDTMLVDERGYTCADPPQTTAQPSFLGGERGGTLAVQQEVPVVLIHTHQAIDVLMNASNEASEQQLGALLALEAHGLATFFDEGWSVDEILESLRVVLPVVQVQAMAKITRRTFGRKLLQLGAAAAVGGIPIPSGQHISEEDRVKLHHALGESIAAGWKLFHRAGNAQVLAVGQAQLSLVQQASQNLYPNIRPIFYSSAYNLIGAAYHFQGRYNDAYKAHEQAYIAALEAMDMLNMAQSRAWQANGLREQRRYSEALQTIEAALRLVSQQRDTESIRLQAHLFASGAEMAAFLGKDTLMQRYLDSSQMVLTQLPYEYNDEFDHTSWHQYKGTCALILNQNNTAAEELQMAIDGLPPQSMIRHIITLTPLAIAYARERQRDRCLETIKRAATVVKTINSSSLNKQFVDYIQQEILGPFADDQDIQAFASETQQRFVLGATSVITS